MLFKREHKIKIVEIHKGGTKDEYFVTYEAKGTKKELNTRIDGLKRASKHYEMFGYKGMTVWV